MSADEPTDNGTGDADPPSDADGLGDAQGSDDAQGPGAERRRMPEAASADPIESQAGRLRHVSALYPLAKMGFIEYDRVLFFSDAVFAIAITLLAVSLHVHPVMAHGRTDVATELSNAVPSITGFGISFVVIALFWIAHHGMFRFITAFDRTLITLNLLFLGVIAFLPFPTEFLSQTSSDYPGATIFYSVCIAAAGIFEGAVWLYATRPSGGLCSPAAARMRLTFALRIAPVPVVFLASIPVALAAPKLAPFSWLAIAVIDRLVSRFAPHRTARPPSRAVSEPPESG